ncbi:hypothetical protein AB6A40_008629 [Gnathostoma spinigerum]|uniref:SAYSvFN domain-containing protein n=1 Tax=Gnathostoma spinigerum TaxID=75299 RepID=A0ABD6EPM4_9BILA
MLKKVEEDLLRYRQKNVVNSTKEANNETNVDDASFPSTISTLSNSDNRRYFLSDVQSSQKSFSLWKSIASFDFFDILPLRVWRDFYASHRWHCILVTFFTWALLQMLFTYVQFGFVFFLFSLLVGLALNLGQRRPGEMSAYSVFNPNCERLLGTLTAEHFERDLLRQNRANN